MLDLPKPGFIAVDKDGNRFTNEAASYHAFTLGMFEAEARLPDRRRVSRQERWDRRHPAR
ncbi:FAD-binding protein [Paraburkholderia panacisoli]|uniref:FAD-binding protein n=1 Tax=Paraburkholderia panacisoli TaxID=2603818 RepID=UPI001FE2889A|nr:FAD-binding protein [Paraburkholderia panacisoli]